MYLLFAHSSLLQSPESWNNVRNQLHLQSQNNYEWLFQQQKITQHLNEDSFAIPLCLWKCLTKNFSIFFSSTSIRSLLWKREWKLSQKNLKWQVKGILLTWLIRSLLEVKFKIIVITYILLFSRKFRWHTPSVKAK